MKSKYIILIAVSTTTSLHYLYYCIILCRASYRALLYNTQLTSILQKQFKVTLLDWFRLSVCLSKPQPTKGTRIIFSEAILQRKLSYKYGQWFLFLASSHSMLYLLQPSVLINQPIIPAHTNGPLSTLLQKLSQVSLYQGLNENISFSTCPAPRSYEIMRYEIFRPFMVLLGVLVGSGKVTRLA